MSLHSWPWETTRCAEHANWLLYIKSLLSLSQLHKMFPFSKFPPLFFCPENGDFKSKFVRRKVFVVPLTLSDPY